MTVIDDDPALLASLKFSLELEGYVVSTYRTGGEFLARPVSPATCLIVDIKLPDMSGFDVLAALKKRGVNAQALFITSHPPANVARRAAGLGIPIVEKPLLGDALLDAIRASFPA